MPRFRRLRHALRRGQPKIGEKFHPAVIGRIKIDDAEIGGIEMSDEHRRFAFQLRMAGSHLRDLTLDAFDQRLTFRRHAKPGTVQPDHLAPVGCPR
ncbi:hypothetical protein D3C72_2141610 [compost metagenome]